MLGGALLEVLQVLESFSEEEPSHPEVLQVLEGAAVEPLLEVPLLQVQALLQGVVEDLVGLLTIAR